MASRQPTTLHEHFRADPRGADSFGKWIEDRVWEMLQRPARVQVWFEGGRAWTSWVLDSGKFSAHTALDALRRYARHTQWHYRIVLLDGTVIKEWPAKET